MAPAAVQKGVVVAQVAVAVSEVTDVGGVATVTVAVAVAAVCAVCQVPATEHVNSSPAAALRRSSKTCLHSHSQASGAPLSAFFSGLAY